MEEIIVSDEDGVKMAVVESDSGEWELIYWLAGQPRKFMVITKETIALIYQIMNTKEVTDELFNELKKGGINE